MPNGLERSRCSKENSKPLSIMDHFKITIARMKNDFSCSSPPASPRFLGVPLTGSGHGGLGALGMRAP